MGAAAALATSSAMPSRRRLQRTTGRTPHNRPCRARGPQSPRDAQRLCRRRGLSTNLAVKGEIPLKPNGPLGYMPKAGILAVLCRRVSEGMRFVRLSLATTDHPNGPRIAGGTPPLVALGSASPTGYPCAHLRIHTTATPTQRTTTRRLLTTWTMSIAIATSTALSSCLCLSSLVCLGVSSTLRVSRVGGRRVVSTLDSNWAT